MHQGYMHHGYMHHGYMYHEYMHHGYMHRGYLHHGYMHHIMDTWIIDTCIMDTSSWVTRPERPKGAKDEVKEARRARSRPEGRTLEVGARRPPKLLVYNNCVVYLSSKKNLRCIPFLKKRCHAGQQPAGRIDAMPELVD